ncbi:MAG: hypothetical protein EBX52_09600 [Proteobacteria bacterium]|nr:hypothetical protein [Pseudomonadota bacterium]
MGVLGYWVLKPSNSTVTETSVPQESPVLNRTEASQLAPVATATPQAVPVVQEASEDPDAKPGPELAAQLESIQKALPTYDSVRGLKEEQVAHRAPPSVIEAGAALGDLEEYLEKRPDEFKSATRFYADCALNDRLLPAARALCLDSLRKRPDQWAKGVSEAVNRVPSEINDLAADL